MSSIDPTYAFIVFALAAILFFAVMAGAIYEAIHSYDDRGPRRKHRLHMPGRHH